MPGTAILYYCREQASVLVKIRCWFHAAIYNLTGIWWSLR